MPTPTRLVLLSRGSGVWWRELLLKTQSLQDLTSLGGDAYDQISIPERITRRDRRSLFDESLKAFRGCVTTLNTRVGEPRPPAADLIRALETEDDYDRPLAVQIAALLHVFGVEAEGRHRMEHLLDRVLGLEYAHWDRTLKISGKPNWQRAIKHGVAQTTLVGVVNGAQAAEQLIGGDPLFREARDIDVPRVRAALSSIVPGIDEGLTALEPDLIGEHHVLKVINDPLLDACLLWAGENGEQRLHILTVLNRATRAEHGAEADRAVKELDRLVATRAADLSRDLITVALGTPGRLLDLCSARVSSLDEPALEAMDAALPQPSLTLMELSLHVAERRAELARQLYAAATAADASSRVREFILNHLAARIGTLGPRLSNLGRHEEALATTQEAVDIYRRLAQSRFDALLPRLALSLNNLGGGLFDLGRHEEALAATQEAVDIYRRLAQSRPDAFLPDLARSLNNLGLALRRHEEALATTQEAVDIYRRLAQSRPDLLPDLAGSLKNLGIALHNLRRHEGALVAGREAVDIYRRLAQSRPDAFLPNLAGSLNNLGIALYNVRRHEETLVASREAVDIYRRLAQSRPDAFLPDPALSLNNLGGSLFDLGRHEEALATTQEAVDVYRRLAQSRSDLLPDLAKSISAHSHALAALDRHQEAAHAAADALRILLPYVERYLETYGLLARTVMADLMRYIAAAGQAPDQTLLEHAARVLTRPDESGNTEEVPHHPTGGRRDG
jgi:tetratricopeptide (TPR) repeat protein